MDRFGDMPMPSLEKRVNDLIEYAQKIGTSMLVEELQKQAQIICEATPKDYSLAGYCMLASEVERSKMRKLLN